MLSNCNNLLAIKKFMVETNEWKNTESDSSIFDLVRGTPLWDKMQKFVDEAIEGSETRIGKMKILCTSIDRKAVKANIASKQAEIENLKKMIALRSDQYELPDGTIMAHKFGNSGRVEE